MQPIARRLIRLFHKPSAPFPQDLPAAISLEELAAGNANLQFVLGPTLEDTAAGGVLDSLTLATLVCLRRPRRIFEIGTGFGRSATLFALNVPEADILTLSLPDNPATGRIFQRQPWAVRIRQLEAFSNRFDYSPWHNQMDFVFVDGCHESPIVEQDTATAFKLVSPSGWIVWHDVDADTPDVLRCLGAAPQRGIAWLKGTRYALWRAC